MKTEQSRLATGMGRLLAAIATVPLCLALATVAQAGSAGNTQIWNRVTVTYNAGTVAQTPAVSNVAIVTVNTVNATPTILAITPSPGSTDGTGTTQSYQANIMTNSNGPGTVALSAGDGSPTNLALSGTTPTITGSLFLGATMFDPTDTHFSIQNIPAGATMTPIAVPNDHGIPSATATTGGGFSDGVINGLALNSIVYISNGSGSVWGPFTVMAVSDPVEGSGTAATPGSITLKNDTLNPIGPFTPAAGWQIVEAKNTTLTVTQGTVTAPASAASWVTTVTATMGTAATANVTTNAHSGSLTVTKYVRNATVASVGTTSTISPALLGGATYYQTGVSGKPGDTLEYLLVINNPGLGSATAVIATDPIPVYTTLLSSSTTYGANNLGSPTTGLFAQALRGAVLQAFHIDNSTGVNTVGWGKSTGITAGNTLTFNIGAGSSAAVGGGGTISTLETDYITYQVTIN